MCWQQGGDLQGVWGWAGKSVTRGGCRNAKSDSSTSAAGIELLKIEKEQEREKLVCGQNVEGFKHRVKDDDSENNVEVLQNSK